MAFQSANLSVLAYANGFTLWHYITPDPTERVTAAGYFNPALAMLRGGDVILARLDSESPRPPTGMMVVTGTDAGAVTVSALTMIGG